MGNTVLMCLLKITPSSYPTTDAPENDPSVFKEWGTFQSLTDSHLAANTWVLFKKVHVGSVFLIMRCLFKYPFQKVHVGSVFLIMR